MKTVVTGKFTAAKQATGAIDQLLRSCVRCDHVRTFLVKPSKTRAAYPAGSSRRKSSRASNQDDYWAIQDTAARAIGLDVKPAPVADGVGVNAYMGSLGGALGKIGDDDRRTPSRPAGIVVAVETSDHVSEVLAISVLGQHGARVIERDAGPWHEGNWLGFNPVLLSSLIDVGENKYEQAALLRPKLNS